MSEDRKIQSRKRYLISFVIGTLAFILVFLLSYSVSYLEFQRVSNIQGDLAYQIFEDKLNYSLFNGEQCSNESFEEISEDLGFQGRIIDDLERKLGKDDPDVLFRKKFYSLIELEHFEFVKELNENCDYNIDTILFFYSNEKSYSKSSEELGKLLDVVHSRNEDLLIYSFDFDLESSLVDNLKTQYNITQPLILVVNDKEKIVNPKTTADIEIYLE